MTKSAPTTALPVVFGSMTIGNAGTAHNRISSLETTNDILDVFQKHGHSEIDCARTYGAGSTEGYLTQAKWQERGLVIDTKLYPTRGRNMEWLTPEVWSHEPKDLRAGLMSSLKALGTEKIDMFYLHAPDRSTPIKETMEEVNKLYQEGYFKRFGISNYASWEVAKMCEICRAHGWVQPVAYQALYNTFQRSVEAELVPCLRYYGIGMYAFQPLAAGFLTSTYKRNQEESEFEIGSRFDPRSASNKFYHDRYLNNRNFDALELLREVMKPHGLTEAECGLRWMLHHSVMKRELKDAIIIGASSPKQLESNLFDLEKGPLPDDVVKALDAGWNTISGKYQYWH